jgi:hypothetical protein
MKRLLALILVVAGLAIVARADDNRPAPCRYPECPPVHGSEPWLCNYVSVFFCRDVFPVLPNDNPTPPPPRTTPPPKPAKDRAR